MYELYLENAAEKDLRKIPVDNLDSIISKIKTLADNPYPAGCMKIKGSEQFWRIRIGHYRVLYEIDEITKSIKIYKVKHRKDAYR